MLTKGQSVFCLIGNEIRTVPTSKSYEVHAGFCIHSVDESCIGASIEALFRNLFLAYQATAKSVKGRTGTASELDMKQVPQQVDREQYIQSLCRLPYTGYFIITEQLPLRSLRAGRRHHDRRG